MEWLSQNWVWILFAVVVLLMFRRHGFGGLLGGHGHHGGQHDQGEGHEGHDERPRTEAAIDPVSGNPVRIEGALTSVFRGRVYYFQSQENRVLFEASPERYAGAARGEALADEQAARSRPHRRRGC
ncbi:MAG: YHS domain-containing protein [Pseudomonadota bacterium]